MVLSSCSFAIALSFAIQSLAAPAGSPHGHDAHLPSEHSGLQHPINHLLRGQLSGDHHQHQHHDSTSSHSSFLADLDAFLDSYNSHPDPDSLIPLPDYNHGASIHHHHIPLPYGTPAQSQVTISSHAPGSSRTSETLATPPQQNKAETRRRGVQGARQEHLGNNAEAITYKFARFHNIEYDQARQHLNRRINKEKADLLKNPDAQLFEKGARMLLFDINHSMRHHTTATTTSESPAAQHQGNQQVASDETSDSTTANRGSNRGRKRKNVEGDDKGTAAEEKKNKRPVKGKGPVALVNQEERERVGKHAETIIAAETIRIMVGVYRDHTGAYYPTALNHIRKGISQDPEQAQQLAADMLSGQKERVKAAIDKIGLPSRLIGRPPVQPPAKSSLALALSLPEDVAERVVQQVALYRKVNREHGLHIVKSGLTPEIAKELQDPLQYQAAVDKLLFRRPYKDRPRGRPM